MYAAPSTLTPLVPRIDLGDPLWHTGKYCDDDGPDRDICGFGVRTGIYMQCIALSLATVTGLMRTLTALPAAIMTTFVMNVILTMKSVQFIFEENPMIQDFWVAQLQLFLLTTIVPFAMLFGQWKRISLVNEVLAGICILYTYTQGLWFWLDGYTQSDEMVCGTADSKIGSWRLLKDNARWAMIATYLVGVTFVLPFALVSYYRTKPGIFFPIWRIVPTRRLSLRAVALGVFTVPLYVWCIVLVERTIRRGEEGQWLTSSGQWFSLEIGISTLIEAAWHTSRCIWSDIKGGAFSEDPEALGVIVQQSTITAEGSYIALDDQSAPLRPFQANTLE